MPDAREGTVFFLARLLWLRHELGEVGPLLAGAVTAVVLGQAATG